MYATCRSDNTCLLDLDDSDTSESTCWVGFSPTPSGHVHVALPILIFFSGWIAWAPPPFSRTPRLISCLCTVVIFNDVEFGLINTPTMTMMGWLFSLWKQIWDRRVFPEDWLDGSCLSSYLSFSLAIMNVSNYYYYYYFMNHKFYFLSSCICLLFFLIKFKK